MHEFVNHDAIQNLKYTNEKTETSLKDITTLKD